MLASSDLSKSLRIAKWALDIILSYQPARSGVVAAPELRPTTQQQQILIDFLYNIHFHWFNQLYDVFRVYYTLGTQDMLSKSAEDNSILLTFIKNLNAEIV